MGYRELQGVLGGPVARIFYGEVRLNEETDRTRPGGGGGGVGLSETGFRAF